MEGSPNAEACSTDSRRQWRKSDHLSSAPHPTAPDRLQEPTSSYPATTDRSEGLRSQTSITQRVRKNEAANLNHTPLRRRPDLNRHNRQRLAQRMSRNRTAFHARLRLIDVD